MKDISNKQNKVFWLTPIIALAIGILPMQLVTTPYQD